MNMILLVACFLCLQVSLGVFGNHGHNGRKVRIHEIEVDASAHFKDVTVHSLNSHEQFDDIAGSAEVMAVEDPGHAQQQNPCSIIGCNSHKCGFVRKVVAMKACRNSKLLGRKELKEKNNSTGQIVKIETLRDCMHAVRHMTDCSPFFEVHSGTRECSCVPIGSDCEEVDDQYRCRYQINEFGPAAGSYLSQDLSWWVNILLIIGIVIAQMCYVLDGKDFKRNAAPGIARSAPVASEDQPALPLYVAADCLAAAEPSASTASPPHLTSPADLAGVAYTEKLPLRKRLVFLDNLKVFLSCTVVLHHILPIYGNNTAFFYNVVVLSDIVACRSPMSDHCKAASITSNSIFKWAFSDFIVTMDQSYFMALFFFISGYFVPSSLDQKGCCAFIQDKVKRLGLPVVWWYLLGGPLLTYFILAGIGAGTSAGGVTYGQNGLWCIPGPPWFNVFLFIFCVLYALCYRDPELKTKTAFSPLKSEAPSITTLLGVGFILGILRSNLPESPFVLPVPGGLSWLIFYIPAFWIGSVAERSRWLDELLDLKIGETWLLRILTMVLAVVQWLSNCLSSQGSTVVDYRAAMTALQGMFCVSMSLVLLDLFHRYLNNGSILASCLSDAAYTVYLIHPWVVVPISWSFTLLVRGFSSQPSVTFWDRELFKVVDVIQCSGEWMIWLGAAYTSVLSLLIVWPLAWFIKQLPLVRDVL